MLSRILYEDMDVIVVHKPAGIAVQTARLGQQDVVSELKNYLSQGKSGSDGSGMSGGRGEPYLGIVHRLDQPVEGILVFAKTKASASALSGQLQKRKDGETFCKRYFAVLCGIPAEREGRLSNYLSKKAVKSGRQTDYRAIVTEPDTGKNCSEGQSCLESRNRPMDSGGKGNLHLAVLEYRILQAKEGKGLALADIVIHTGRFHQIRAQMAYAGMPLLGDLKYGTGETKALAQSLGIRNVALCAYQMSFIHPVSKEKMEYRIRPENPAFSSFSQL